MHGDASDGNVVFVESPLQLFIVQDVGELRVSCGMEDEEGEELRKVVVGFIP